MAAKRKPMDKLEGVRYIGTNDRAISVQDFSSAGVSADVDLRWDDSNSHFVPISSVNAATADYLAEQDDFELV